MNKLSMIVVPLASLAIMSCNNIKDDGLEFCLETYQCSVQNCPNDDNENDITSCKGQLKIAYDNCLLQNDQDIDGMDRLPSDCVDAIQDVFYCRFDSFVCKENMQVKFDDATGDNKIYSTYEVTYSDNCDLLVPFVKQACEPEEEKMVIELVDGEEVLKEILK